MRSLLFVRAGLGESEINFLDADLTDHRGFLFGTKKFLRRGARSPTLQAQESISNHFKPKSMIMIA
jgi:hypothetical protein